MKNSKRAANRKVKKMNKQTTNWIAISWIVGGAVLIALALIFLPKLLTTNDEVSLGLNNIIVPDPVTGVVTNGLTIGDPDAPAKLVEFADFQCPACKNFALQIEPTLITNYVKTGRLSFTFVPFSFIDEYSKNNSRESKAAAEAAYCASDQGRFWDYYNILFANQEGENIGSYSTERLYAFAKKINLDTTVFKSCFDSGKYKQKVLDDRTYAQSLGLDSTPSFSLNGEILSFSNYDQLYAAIEALSPQTK